MISLWGRGYVRTDALQFNENGVADLVRYILKRAVESKKRRWIPSKNLKCPQVKECDGRISARQIRELAKDTQNNREYEKYYNGYYFSGADVVFNDTNGGTYIYARFYKKEAEFCRVTNRVRKQSR